MGKRRIRATLLLRCVVLGLCVAAFALVLTLSTWTGLTIATVVILAAIWIIGIELDLLPDLIERALTKRARESGQSASSMWFVDLDQESRGNWDGFVDDTEDNPTIR